ncbi:PilZ domain-containing protein [Sapientia aquatica]|uniref:PilZ domain-containing protein n=1 Tax=Sapientia aquatica TaxID=1549640 RepID=A0A4R5VYM0_9BURK|nr:PilZ domain-containing protein [Sapientia aquatica]TDK64476.1 PilZ domain-containing protein [Sapientia aquatica]
MVENRSVPRLMVAWHAALRLPSKQIVRAKVVNISSSGMQFTTAEHLIANQKYEMQITVPDLNGSTSTTLVPCFIECLYTILSGGDYRVGAKFSGMAPEHKTLIARWSEKAMR